MAAEQPIVRHISFATPNYARAARQLRKSTGQFGLSTVIYTTDHPVFKSLCEECPEIMAERKGAGYWLWKPAIILDALERSPEGGLVFYTDAGVHLIADPAPLCAITRDHPIVLFEHTGGHLLQSSWTKRDAFVLLDADRPEFWSSRQLTASFQIYRNCELSSAFVAELLNACKDARILTDKPNTQGQDNLPNFRAHRHDQAILTIIADRHGVRRWPDPSQYHPEGAAQFFFQHRKPDRGFLTRLRGRIWGIDTGSWDA